MIPCIVPARAGSKGIPDKNLSILGDMPLVSWAVKASVAAETISEVHCSTDSEAIAAAACNAGAICESLRPAELSTDTTMVVDVLRYELDQLRQRGLQPSHLCLVQATSPFVAAHHIDTAVKLALNENHDVVCTGRPVGPDHPDAMFEIDSDGSVTWATSGRQRSRRRQDGPALFVRAGLVYVYKSTHIETCGDDYFSGSTGCIEVDRASAQSIDDELDLEWCRFLLERHKSNLESENAHGFST